MLLIKDVFIYYHRNVLTRGGNATDIETEALLCLSHECILIINNGVEFNYTLIFKNRLKSLKRITKDKRIL